MKQHDFHTSTDIKVSKIFLLPFGPSLRFSYWFQLENIILDGEGPFPKALLGDFGHCDFATQDNVAIRGKQYAAARDNDSILED